MGEWLLAHHDQPVTVAALAAAMGLSVRHVQALCRAHYGRSPMRLLRDIRLDHAHAALLTTPAPALATVAAGAGFTRLARFTAAYRQQLGETPAQTLHHARCRPATPAPTLAFLAWAWGDAYLLSHAGQRWVALRRDARYFLTADTLAGLEQAITADHAANPVPRDFDPPQESELLPDPAIIMPPGPDDAGLDTDTLITLTELRRAFPDWAILYSTQLRAWVAITAAATLCQHSAVSLSIALTLIERRTRQLTPAAPWTRPAWPGPG